MKNLPNRNLSNDEISLLKKGLNFAPTPKTISLLSIILSIEKALFHLSADVAVKSRLMIIGVLKKARLPQPNLSK